MEQLGFAVLQSAATDAGGGSAFDRVVLHVDLDCFYAAVEQVRLGIPREVPLAVQQWEGLIAVNYPARAAGVVRHDRVSEALRKLSAFLFTTLRGDLLISHLQKVLPTYSLLARRIYLASSHVFSIFRRFTDLSEKASIDEVYLDVTDQVEEMVEKECNWDTELQRLLSSTSGESATLDSSKKSDMIVEIGPLLLDDQNDKRLLAGAIIAEKIRSTVRSELGYTCSVGIATNKLLAKIASARNKPDHQTLILPRAVPELMQKFPLKKIKMLGGKLGEELKEKWSCETAGDVQAVPLGSLIFCFGERLGNYIFKAVRGIYADKVQSKQVSKSMLAAKSFSATDDLTVIRRWLGVLAEELAIRIFRDVEQNHRQPKFLQLHYRSGSFQHSSEHSKSCPLPQTALRLLSSSRLDLSEISGISICGSSEESGFREGHLEPLKENHENSDVNDNLSVEQNVLESESAFIGSVIAPLAAGELVKDIVSKPIRSLANVLQDATFSMFRQLDGALPCTRLAIAAQGFQQLPSQVFSDLVPFFHFVNWKILQSICSLGFRMMVMQGSKSIQHFFTATPQTREAPKKNAEVVHRGPKGIMKFMVPASEADGTSILSHVENTRCAISCETIPSKYEVERLSTVADSDSSQIRGQTCSTVETEASHLLYNGVARILSEPKESTGPLFYENNPNFDQLVKLQCRATDDYGSRGGVYDVAENNFAIHDTDEGTHERIDLSNINKEEQHHILQSIYSSRASVVGSEKCRASGSHHQQNRALKRRRQPDAQSGQQSISSFFHSFTQTSDPDKRIKGMPPY
ncbi:hypothetical protein O6H91_06G040100 [Diphasiastrum complanatum]|uniref:Uncharacterized protein n=1 Tax=Diphasiastrum complanatum TaxID=34168 RepID=A0ACC2DCV5_DIPCM|nr:hypothetical protein O6H91_06G040100 [Diphasiastrum complanatum]